MIDLILNIKNFVFNVFQGVWEGINHLTDQIPKNLLELRNIKSKFANLEDTNFQVADMHLKNGHINDAILRLTLIKRFISPQNSMKANYQLAWCHFIKGNLERSLSYLRISNDFDEIGLSKYLLTPHQDKIPEALLGYYKNLTASSNYHQFIDKNANLHIMSVEMLIRNMQALPHQAQILDLGACNGLNGQAMALVFPHKNYDVTAVENSEQMCYEIKDSQCYNNVIYKSIEKFLSINDLHYNSIIASNSLSFIKDLSWYFKRIRLALVNDGVFVFSLQISNETKLDTNRMKFIYSQEEIEKTLQECKLEIIETKTQKLNYDEVYMLAACKALE